MDIAIVLGGHQGHGLAIARRMIEMGLRVCALGPSFQHTAYQHKDYTPIAVDMTSSGNLDAVIQQIGQLQGKIYALILADSLDNAGTLETLPAGEIAPRVQHGLTFPLQLLSHYLPELIRQRGHLIQLARPPAQQGVSPLDDSMHAAWDRLVQSLFNEMRDTGVKVCRLLCDEPYGPEGNRDAQSRLPGDRVAQAVESLLRFPEGALIGELVLRPQATREEPKIARTISTHILAAQDVRLPREDLDQEVEAPIPTPLPDRNTRHERPEASVEEEEYEDDEYVEPELQYLIRGDGQGNQNREKQSDRDPRPPRDKSDESAPKRPRRRGRGRGRKGASSDKPVEEQGKEPSSADTASASAEKSPEQAEAPKKATDKPAARPARRPRRRTAKTTDEAPDKKQSEGSGEDKPSAPAKKRPRRRKPSRQPPPSSQGGPGRDET